MTAEQMQLTHLEEVKAYADAGINSDMTTWDDATLDRAVEVLDRAQAAKVERLTLHHKPICTCPRFESGKKIYPMRECDGCRNTPEEMTT